MHLEHQALVEADTCIYIQKQGRNISIVSIYVNDCLIIGSHMQVNDIKSSLTKRFKIKDLGLVESILGIKVLCVSSLGVTLLCQSGHIDSLLSKFNMINAKPVTVPLHLGLNLVKIDQTLNECHTIPVSK